jgi:hypothetical protein
MFKNKFWMSLAIVIMACLVLGQSGAFAQAKKKCLFLSEDPDPGFATDATLIAWMKTLYTVTIEDVDNTKGTSPAVSLQSILDAKYDFIFVSESVGSSDAANFKGFSVPLFLTELWGSRIEVMAWVANNTGTYGNTTSSETKVKILDGSSPLAAGYATDTELTVVTDSENATDYLTYTKPSVDCIKVAGLSADPTKIVVLGVEKGTVLYNKADTKDGSLVSKARCAAVGINANGNKFMTDDAKKLIQAGITWITSAGTAVETKPSATPDGFTLSQNYPNPFNPMTHISFTLGQAGRTTLKVYDVMGKEVATVLDETLSAGRHAAWFDASRLNSGVYFYEIRCGAFTGMQKMVLMK